MTAAQATPSLQMRALPRWLWPPLQTKLPAMSTHAPAFNPADVPEDATVAIVAARFNAHIVDDLLAGCVRRLRELGFDEDRVVVHRVPGAFELPVAAQVLAESEEYAAIICLG